MNYLYVHARIIAADPSLLGLSKRYEDKGCQSCRGVIATETALQTHMQENRFLLKS